MMGFLATSALYAMLVAFVLAVLALLTALTGREHSRWLNGASTVCSLTSIVLTILALILNAL